MGRRRRNRQRQGGAKSNGQHHGMCDVVSTPAPLPPTAADADGAAAANDELDKRRERDDKMLDAYRDSLNKHAQDTGKEYDKAILTVAALAFGFSVSLIKDYIKPEGADLHATWLLYTSWGLFGIPVALILANLQLSHSAATKYVDIADIAGDNYNGSETFWDDLKAEIKCVKRTKVVAYFNWISLGSVIAGILALALFAGLNTKGTHGSQQPQGQSAAAAATTTTTTTTTTVTTPIAAAPAADAGRVQEGTRNGNAGDAPRADQDSEPAAVPATQEVTGATLSDTRVKPGQGDRQRTSTPSTPRVPLTTPQQRPPTQPATQPKK